MTRLVVDLSDAALFALQAQAQNARRTPPNQAAVILEMHLGVSSAGPPARGGLAPPAPGEELTPLAPVRQGDRCLVPDRFCRAKPMARGLCSAHYMKVRYYMREGYLSEAWLIQHGRLLARMKGRGDVGPFAEPREMPKKASGGDVRWFFGLATAYTPAVVRATAPEQGPSRPSFAARVASADILDDPGPGDLSGDEGGVP